MSHNNTNSNYLSAQLWRCQMQSGHDRCFCIPLKLGVRPHCLPCPEIQAGPLGLVLIIDDKICSANCCEQACCCVLLSISCLLHALLLAAQLFLWSTSYAALNTYPLPLSNISLNFTKWYTAHLRLNKFDFLTIDTPSDIHHHLCWHLFAICQPAEAFNFSFSRLLLTHLNFFTTVVISLNRRSYFKFTLALARRTHYERVSQFPCALISSADRFLQLRTCRCQRYICPVLQFLPALIPPHFIVSFKERYPHADTT